MATRLVENYVGRLLSEDLEDRFPNPRIWGYDDEGRPIGPGTWPDPFDPVFGPVDFTPGLDDRYRPADDGLPPEREPPINPNYERIRDRTPFRFPPVVTPEQLPIDGLNDPTYLPPGMRPPVDFTPDFTDFPFPFGPRIPIRVPGLPRTTPAAPPVIG